MDPSNLLPYLLAKKYEGGLVSASGSINLSNIEALLNIENIPLEDRQSVAHRILLYLNIKYGLKMEKLNGE